MEDIEELCVKLRPIIGNKADKLWQAYLTGDRDARSEMEGIIRLLAAKHLTEGQAGNMKILLVPPDSALAHGDYPLATLIYNDTERGEFGLREDELTQHIGIFGRTGAGKTNVAFLLISNLLHAQKPFLIFDWKRNYRDILAAEEVKDRILVFTPGRNISPFSFNPLIPPPGTSPTTWIKKLIEIGVDILICGGIDETSAWKLQFHEVKLYAWVTGEAEDALSCFLRGELESGVMIAADGHRCGMWKFKRNGAPWNNDPGGPARVRRQGEGHGRGRRRGRSRF